MKFTINKTGKFNMLSGVILIAYISILLVNTSHHHQIHLFPERSCQFQTNCDTGDTKSVNHSFENCLVQQVYSSIASGITSISSVDVLKLPEMNNFLSFNTSLTSSEKGSLPSLRAPPPYSC